MQLTELLKISLFKGLNETDVVKFLYGAPSNLRRYNAGDSVARQGNLCRGAYILISGRVRCSMSGDDGKEITVDEMTAPCILASAFIFATENRFPVNVEALVPCELYIIGKAHFLEFMHKHPVMLENFLRDISDRGVFLSRKVNEFALQNLKTRILAYLEKNPDIHNQREVAQRLGATRPSLARALSELIAENKIKKG